MTVLPRNLLIGSFIMVAALGAASCSSTDTGQTLTVEAVPNSPVFVQGNAQQIMNPVINYRGKKPLKYVWTYDLPAGGELTASGTDRPDATFTFQQLGSYTLKLFVYEDGGSISNENKGIVEVTSFATLTADVTAPAISGTPDIITGRITGSSALSVVVSGGRLPYSYTWTVPTPIGSLSSSASANPVLSVTANPGTIITTTVTISDSQNPPAQAIITVQIPVSSAG